MGISAGEVLAELATCCGPHQRPQSYTGREPLPVLPSTSRRGTRNSLAWQYTNWTTQWKLGIKSTQQCYKRATPWQAHLHCCCACTKQDSNSYVMHNVAGNHKRFTRYTVLVHHNIHCTLYMHSIRGARSQPSGEPAVVNLHNQNRLHIHSDRLKYCTSSINTQTLVTWEASTCTAPLTHNRRKAHRPSWPPKHTPTAMLRFYFEVPHRGMTWETQRLHWSHSTPTIVIQGQGTSIPQQPKLQHKEPVTQQYQ